MNNAKQSKLNESLGTYVDPSNGHTVKGERAAFSKTEVKVFRNSQYSQHVSNADWLKFVEDYIEAGYQKIS